MPYVDEERLLTVLKALSEMAPAPLYPARYARETGADRGKLDAALDELRRRGFVQFTEWVKDLGQGYALTEAGKAALASRRLTPVTAAADERENADRPLGDFERGEIVRNAIFYPAPAYVSRILLWANLLYFAFGAYYAQQHNLSVSDYLWGEGRSTIQVLIQLGALHPALVFPDPDERPQLERLLLCLFLHIGPLHLFMNMYFLYSFAQQIEPMWGSARFLAIYFVSGIVSSCVVLLIFEFEQLPPHEIGVTAGASGCLYGVFVSMMVWFAFNKKHLPERLIQDWSRNTMVNVFLLIAINFLPHISWQGHLGGAIGGTLAAMLLHAPRFHPSAAVRRLALGGVAAVPVAFFVAMLWQAGRL